MRTKSKYLKSLALMAAMINIPTMAFAYGEGEDIPMEARAVHLLTNEARNDPTAALANCGSACKTEEKCYTQVMAPFYWNDKLYHAAQYHANNLSAIHCMQHDSPCTLIPDAAKSFPECDGNPSCACKGGKATCGTTGTDTWTRIKYFGVSGGAENLASVSTPLRSFNMWLYEESKKSGCKWTTNNGHRQNILTNTNVGIGVGWSSYIVSQDMGTAPSEKPALTSGAYYVDGNTTWFKTQYYNTKTAVSKVAVSVAGTCTDLQMTRGTANHGIWGASNIAEPQTCAQFFFESKDTAGNIVRFPTTGSLLYNCGKKSWSKDAEGQTCLGTIVPPEPDPEPDPDPTPDPEPDPDPTPDPEPDPDPTPDPEPDPIVTPAPDPVDPDDETDPDGTNSTIHGTSSNCNASPLRPEQSGWIFLLPAFAIPFLRRRKS